MDIKKFIEEELLGQKKFFLNMLSLTSIWKSGKSEESKRSFIINILSHDLWGRYEENKLLIHTDGKADQKVKYVHTLDPATNAGIFS